jgi:hypothetical protein
VSLVDNSSLYYQFSKHHFHNTLSWFVYEYLFSLFHADNCLEEYKVDYVLNVSHWSRFSWLCFPLNKNNFSTC